MAAAAQQHALASLKGLLESGAYSDLTISCNGDAYKVHKNIVCDKVDFFTRALRFGGKESQNDAIDLPEDDPAIVRRLIQYLYEAEYTPLLSDVASTGSARCHYNEAGYFLGAGTGCCAHFTCDKCEVDTAVLPSLNGREYQLLLHVKMYEIADKYEVRGLKDLAREKFQRSCKQFWDSDVFAVAAHHVFSSTPDSDKGLRDLVSLTISKHMCLMDKPEIEALLTEFNGLAFGLLKLTRKRG
ncbi:uncharacterized protein J4E87_000971 [Alternaria ethzedia]|uniref:uncharacterized protein n=1 Tax=Alternaria ethzedia TaxID=181014 RepID=UPI0020C45B21|nr:uncharacterized protein J4E87_000971 [Alternaria ethzedia]KAI4633805.1 hypothetical protein J4E87_000971 [Alternaria ethzedia]